jgi:hypothetical protein
VFSGSPLAALIGRDGSWKNETSSGCLSAVSSARAGSQAANQQSEGTTQRISSPGAECRRLPLGDTPDMPLGDSVLAF